MNIMNIHNHRRPAQTVAPLSLHLATSSRQFQTEMLGSESASPLAVSSCSVPVCEGGGGRLASSHPAQYISV